MIKQSLLLVIGFLFLSHEVHAAFVAGSYGVRHERESETSEMTANNPYGVVIGHRVGSFTWTGEYLTYGQQTGNQTLNVSRKQHLGLLGTRFHLFDREELFSWYPYLSGGVGLYREDVRTVLFGVKNDQVSEVKSVGTMGVGFFGQIVPHIRLGADFRILLATDFDPRGLLDLSLRLGYQFD